MNLEKLHYTSREIHFAHCMTIRTYLGCVEQIGKFKKMHTSLSKCLHSHSNNTSTTTKYKE